MYEVFEHTADLGLRVRAATRDDLFCQAAEGLFSLIVANLEDVRPVESFQFRILGDDVEYLLFDWLSELIYAYETRHIVLRQFEVRFTETGLEATARGEPADEHRHHLDHEVKAITYHGLKVTEEQGAYVAEVIVDI